MFIVPIRAANSALPAAHKMPKASAAAAMHLFFQDSRNSNETPSAAAAAFGRQKAEGMGRHALPAVFCPPCFIYGAPPLSGTPGSMIPPGTLRLKRMAGFRHCGAQKQRLSLRNEARPKKVRPLPATQEGEKRKSFTKGLLQKGSESHASAKGVAQACL